MGRTWTHKARGTVKRKSRHTGFARNVPYLFPDSNGTNGKEKEIVNKKVARYTLAT